MVEYLCHRCGYNTNKKCNIIQHLNRKNVCSPILGDISIEDIKKHYNLANKLLNPNEPKMNPNEPKLNPNEPKMNPNDSKITPNETSLKINPIDYNETKYECIYCNKYYSTNSNMRKHEKTCKIKIEKEKNDLEKDNEIKELKEMVEKLLVNSDGNTITNNTNNNSNNNSNNNTNSNNTINNTININNYGEENTKYITSDFILNLLKFKPAKVIPELIKHTHFNEAHPENHNIKITNKKGPHIKVMKNNKWEFQNKEETITDLIDRQQMHLNNEDVEEKIEEKCSISEKNNIDRCISLYNSDDKDYMKRLYNDSELIVINNSNK